MKIQQFAIQLHSNLVNRIDEDALLILIRNAFRDWDEESLIKLIHLANSTPGRHYGEESQLVNQFRILKERYQSVVMKSDTGKSKTKKRGTS